MDPSQSFITRNNKYVFRAIRLLRSATVIAAIISRFPRGEKIFGILFVEILELIVFLMI